MTDHCHAFVNGRNFHYRQLGPRPAVRLEVGGKVHRLRIRTVLGRRGWSKTKTLQQACIGPESAIRFGERIALGQCRTP